MPADIPDQQWEAIKDVVLSRYIIQDQPLKEVMRHLAAHGFHASYVPMSR